jgi:hypothetical protein
VTLEVISEDILNCLYKKYAGRSIVEEKLEGGSPNIAERGNQ